MKPNRTLLLLVAVLALALGALAKSSTTHERLSRLSRHSRQSPDDAADLSSAQAELPADPNNTPLNTQFDPQLGLFKINKWVNPVAEHEVNNRNIVHVNSWEEDTTVFNPQEAKVNCPQANVKAISLGFEDNLTPYNLGRTQGGYCQLLVNSKDYAKGTRGHNLIVVDPKTLEVTLTDAYDTWGSATESQRLATALQGIPDGSIVAMAVNDEGTLNANDARTAIQQMWKMAPDNAGPPDYRGSWAFVGIKGGAYNVQFNKHAGPGSVVEYTYKSTGCQ